jgi:hypothetical protein
MITYIIQVVLFQIAFLAVYDFFLSKETFYKYNRAYLLATPIISFVLPLIKIPTLQKAVPDEVMVFLPEVMLSPQKVFEQTTYYSESSINYLSILFWSGVVFFAFIFSIKLIKIIRLIIRNDSVQKSFYRLIFLHKQSKAFSFFHFIFLGRDIPKQQQEDIIKHEMVHAKQKHSLDLLFFELLRIVMWFNPMIYFYQHRITLLHEYISDAEVVKSTQKTAYFNKLLSQTFEVENISFVNQFYKQSFIKKRITMMTKNKSKQIKKVKYLLLLPLLVGMLMYSSCSTEDSSFAKDEEIAELKQKIKDLEKQYHLEKEMKTYLLRKSDSLIKNGNDVPYAIIEEVPVYPGCVGTRAEKAACLNMKIKKFTMKNFNVGLSKELGLSKGAKKIWTIFRIDKKGNVVDVKARAPHPKLKEEAERVARMLPKMEPGKQRGKPVGMKYTLPISFVVE